MKIYRVSPQLDISKDVKANSQEEAEMIVHNEAEKILLVKGGAMDKFFDAGYLELGGDSTFIVDSWEEEEEYVWAEARKGNWI
tara:strand:- start:765 stop:1013 length:249 start_codon:yes stop_codon:yes gene_type:complete